MQNTAKTAKRRADDGPTLPEKLDKPYKKPGKTNEKLEKQCKTLEKPPENYTGKHKKTSTGKSTGKSTGGHPFGIDLEHSIA